MFKFMISFSVMMLMTLEVGQASEGVLQFRGMVQGQPAQASVQYFTYQHTGSGTEFNGVVQVGQQCYSFNAFGANGQLYLGGRMIGYITLQISERNMVIQLDNGQAFYFQRYR